MLRRSCNAIAIVTGAATTVVVAALTELYRTSPSGSCPLFFGEMESSKTVGEPKPKEGGCRCLCFRQQGRWLPVFLSMGSSWKREGKQARKEGKLEVLS